MFLKVNYLVIVFAVIYNTQEKTENRKCYICREKKCDDNKAPEAVTQCENIMGAIPQPLCAIFKSDNGHLFLECAPDQSKMMHENCSWDWERFLKGFGVPVPKHLENDKTGCFQTCKTDGCNNIQWDGVVNWTLPNRLSTTSITPATSSTSAASSSTKSFNRGVFLTAVFSVGMAALRECSLTYY